MMPLASFCASSAAMMGSWMKMPSSPGWEKSSSRVVNRVALRYPLLLAPRRQPAHGE